MHPIGVHSRLRQPSEQSGKKDYPAKGKPDPDDVFAIGG
jgi:hypothetical protein